MERTERIKEYWKTIKSGTEEERKVKNREDVISRGPQLAEIVRRR